MHSEGELRDEMRSVLSARNLSRCLLSCYLGEHVAFGTGRISVQFTGL